MDLPDIRTHKLIAIDTETLDPRMKLLGPGQVQGSKTRISREYPYTSSNRPTYNDKGFIVGISIATSAGYSDYFPVGHNVGNNVDPDMIRNWLNDMFSSKSTSPVIGTNIIYDVCWLRTFGVEIHNTMYDIIHAEALINEEQSKYSLEALANKYLGKQKQNTEMEQWALSRGYKAIENMDLIPPEIVAPYAIADAELPIEIWDKQYDEICRQELWDVFMLECRLIPLMRDMKFKGVKVDLDKAEQLSKQGKEDIIRIQKELDDIAGRPVNVSASADLAALFEAKGLPYNRTEKGNPSFTAPWLATQSHELAHKIIERRTTEKNIRDFVDGSVLKHNHNGRIHSEFHQLRGDEYGTRSGRFSSSNPNLQQVPKRDKKWGKLIRELYIPDDGYLWGHADYNQQELRLACYYGVICGYGGASELALKYINNIETDFHQEIADMCGIERGPAKNINFGICYGMGTNKMAAELGVSVGDAKYLLNLHRSKVPFMRELANLCMQTASERGYIKTIGGRCRHFNLFEPSRWTPGAKALPYDEALIEYPGQSLRRSRTFKAFNALIQGGSGDMTKTAMVRLYENHGVVPHLTVHDELNFSVESLEQLQSYANVMELAIPLKFMLDNKERRLPMHVDTKLGTSWGESL